MGPRGEITVRKHRVGPESEKMLLEETILRWRELGPAAAWQAIHDILDWWLIARGLAPEDQRVDRSHIEIHPVPWLVHAEDDRRA